MSRRECHFLLREWEGLAYHLHVKLDLCICVACNLKVQSCVIRLKIEEICSHTNSQLPNIIFIHKCSSTSVTKSIICRTNSEWSQEVSKGTTVCRVNAEEKQCELKVKLQ